MAKKNLKISVREKVFRWFFLAGDRFRAFYAWMSGLCRFFFTVSFLLFILLFIYYIGYNYSSETSEGLTAAFKVIFLTLYLSKYLPEILYFKKGFRISFAIRVLIFIFSSNVLLANFSLADAGAPFWRIFYGNTLIIIAIFLIITSEISGLLRLLSRIKIPPALVFSSGFLLVIVLGSGLLLLPKAHVGQLTYLDSLFTSVSAVCVTGLVVVDTTAKYTFLGKVIILCLIQIGGLGIMTFTGFFSYIFTSSGSSFRNKLLLKEIFSSESLNNLFKLLAKIIIITFLTELIGAIIIYSSLKWNAENKVFFSVFHAISAFCNAGFSTLQGGLNSPSLRGNFSLQIAVAVLIILGGIGFPVLVNVYSSLKHTLISVFRKMNHSRVPVKSGKKNIPSRIVLFTTGVLLVAGTALYYAFESGRSLYGMDFSGKLITSFFGSVSARTAGFNTVDISLWSYPTMFLMIFLMWIGASPGSTGGGIKTTTFALMVKSVWNNLRGRDHLIIGNREISPGTISRVLSIIFLSILIIGTGFFGLLFTEPEKNPVHLLFECASAYGTVGLSIANTSTFSQTGKIIIILLMFIGRVGPLTLFTGLLLSHKKRYYRYPELEIPIN